MTQIFHTSRTDGVADDFHFVAESVINCKVAFSSHQTGVAPAILKNACRKAMPIAVHPVMGHGTIHSTSRIFRLEALQDLDSWAKTVSCSASTRVFQLRGLVV